MFGGRRGRNVMINWRHGNGSSVDGDRRGKNRQGDVLDMHFAGLERLSWKLDVDGDDYLSSGNDNRLNEGYPGGIYTGRPSGVLPNRHMWYSSYQKVSPAASVSPISRTCIGTQKSFFFCGDFFPSFSEVDRDREGLPTITLPSCLRCVVVVESNREAQIRPSLTRYRLDSTRSSLLNSYVPSILCWSVSCLFLRLLLL